MTSNENWAESSLPCFPGGRYNYELTFCMVGVFENLVQVVAKKLFEKIYSMSLICCSEAHKSFTKYIMTMRYI